MNKTKMILAATGGAIGLVVLVLAFFTWRAYSARTAAIEGDYDEGVDGLETVLEKAQELSRKKVYPCQASVTAIESNRQLVASWSDEALQIASRGDRVFEKTTAAAFKSFIIADAKRLLPDFAFGPFKEYIADGKMPAEDQLQVLQRKWNDVSTIVETLLTNGVAEVVDIQFKEPAAAQKTSDRPEPRSAGKKKGGAKAKDAEALREPAANGYVVTFAAKPSALTKVFNALAVCERYIVVEDFSLTRTADEIAAALGGDDKKAEAKQAAGRRSRRRTAQQVVEKKAEEEEAPKNVVVTDPAKDAPIHVTMTATVYDFRSLEEEGEVK